MVIVKIFADKHYLIGDLIETFDFKEVLLSLNSLIISYNIISELNVYPVLKIIILLVFTYLLSRIMKKEVIFIGISVLVFAKQILTNNIIFLSF